MDLFDLRPSTCEWGPLTSQRNFSSFSMSLENRRPDFPPLPFIRPSVRPFIELYLCCLTLFPLQNVIKRSSSLPTPQLPTQRTVMYEST